jgi:hypothetical protein
MLLSRIPIAADPRRFGKRFEAPAALAEGAAASLGDDVRLFALTFTAGFLFVSVLIA